MKNRRPNRTYRRDLELVTLVRGPARGDDDVFARLTQALDAARAVYMGEGCLTRIGAAYLRVPFRR